jgi:hypothetical protein
MSSKQPIRHAVSGLPRAVLFGAFLGMTIGVFGVVWSARGDGVPVDPHQLESQGIFGTLGGAVVAFVLYLTRPYRARGMIQNYCSWALASVIAVFVLLIPAIPEDGWKSVVLLSVLLGVGAGLGLGVAAQQVSQDRWW